MDHIGSAESINLASAMTGSSSQQRQTRFAALLNALLDGGARPIGHTERHRRWSNVEFAEAVGASDRSVRNWRSGNALPADLAPIVKAFFGEEAGPDVYELQDAFGSARRGELGSIPPQARQHGLIERGDAITAAAIIEYFTQSYRNAWGFGSLKEAARAIVNASRSLDNDKVLAVLYGKPASQIVRVAVAQSIAIVCRENLSIIENDAQLNPINKAYILRILTENDNLTHSSDGISPALREFCLNVESTSAPIRRGLQSGIYQVLRRYALQRYDSYFYLEPEGSRAEDGPQFMLSELIFISSAPGVCLFIDSRLNISRGFIYESIDGFVYIMFQSPAAAGAGSFRLFALRVERSDLSIQFGISTGVGSTTLRPIATNCLLTRVDERSHQALYSAMSELAQSRTEAHRPASIEPDSIIADYISAEPSHLSRVKTKGPRRVLELDDIPSLKGSGLGSALFGVPIRPPPLEVAFEFQSDHPVVILRNSAK